MSRGDAASWVVKGLMRGWACCSSLFCCRCPADDSAAGEQKAPRDRPVTPDSMLCLLELLMILNAGAPGMVLRMTTKPDGQQ